MDDEILYRIFNRVGLFGLYVFSVYAWTAFAWQQGLDLGMAIVP